MQAMKVQIVSPEVPKETRAANIGSGKKGASFESILESVQTKASTDGKKLQKNVTNSKNESLHEACVEKGSPVAEQGGVPQNRAVSEEKNGFPSQEKKPSQKKGEGEKSETVIVPNPEDDGPTVTAVLDICAPEQQAASVQSVPAFQILDAPSSSSLQAEVPAESEDSLNMQIASSSQENVLDKPAAPAVQDAVLKPQVMTEALEEVPQEVQTQIASLPQEENALPQELSSSAKEKEAVSSQKPSKKGAALKVIDERTPAQPVLDASALKAVSSVEESSGKDVASVGVKPSAGESLALTQQVVQQNVQQDILASNDQSASATGSTFQQMLSQQIQQNAPEFVKAGSVVLRDNDSGQINLIMRPQSLGNVKIRLELSDKVIAGQITVNSREALEAFRENLTVLKQAFEQSGFDSANFNLNLADGSAGGFHGQGQQQSGEQYLSSRTYGNFVQSGESQPSAETTEYKSGSDYGIDVVA